LVDSIEYVKMHGPTNPKLIIPSSSKVMGQLHREYFFLRYSTKLFPPQKRECSSPFSKEPSIDPFSERNKSM
jgi:hypothetical protein